MVAMTATLAASSAESPASGLLFRQPEATAIPWAGVILLVALFVLVLLARWWGPLHKRKPWLKALGGRWGGRCSALPQEPGVLVEHRMRLNDNTCIYSIRWADQRLLIATTTNAQPAVLARISSDAPQSETVL